MRPSVTVRDGICLSSDTDPTDPVLDRLVRDPGDDESPPSLAVAILTLSHPPFISAPFSYQSREGAVVKSDPKIERARLTRSLFDLSALRFQRRREGKDCKMKWCPAYSILVVRQSHTGSGWFHFSAKHAPGVRIGQVNFPRPIWRTHLSVKWSMKKKIWRVSHQWDINCSQCSE